MRVESANPRPVKIALARTRCPFRPDAPDCVAAFSVSSPFSASFAPCRPRGASASCASSRASPGPTSLKRELVGWLKWVGNGGSLHSSPCSEVSCAAMPSLCLFFLCLFLCFLAGAEFKYRYCSGNWKRKWVRDMVYQGEKRASIVPVPDASGIRTIASC